MPQETLRITASLQHWVCENAKSTRAYLKRVGEVLPLAAPIQAQTLTELPREIHKKGDHLGGFDARPLLAAALHGHDLGLVSEAGMPAVADPGSSVVRAAHQLGIPVIPLVGPVSLLLALAASGLNGQNFAFVGYVPSQPAERALRLKALEKLALQTQQPGTRLATSSGLTLPGATHYSGDIKTWKAKGWALDNATPTVFAIGA